MQRDKRLVVCNVSRRQAETTEHECDRLTFGSRIRPEAWVSKMSGFFRRARFRDVMVHHRC